MGNIPGVQSPSRTGPLTQLPKPVQQPTTQTPTVPNNGQPPNVQSPGGNSTTPITTVEVTPPPPPPPLLKNGDASPAVGELNKLLKSVGLVRHVGNSYTAETEKAIKQFQHDNGLPETGGLDEKTLRKLIDSTKADEENFPKLEALLGVKFPEKPHATRPTAPVVPQHPAPTTTPPTTPPATNPTATPQPTASGTPTTPAPTEPTAPVAPKTYANDNERVKDLVATQLSAKGADPEKAFEVGGKLKDAAAAWDRRMPSSSMCYTAVKRAIDDAIHIPYKVFSGKAYPNGGWAKTAGTNLLSKSPEFVKIEGLSRSDLDNLPAGAVIVYKPPKGPGHIGVQDGSGHDISDKTRTQANVYRTAPYEVYFPVSVRGED